MHSFDEVAGYLDDIVDSLPEYVVKGLTGGVYLIPEAKQHPVLPLSPIYGDGRVYSGPGFGTAHSCVLQFCHGKICGCQCGGY